MVVGVGRVVVPMVLQLGEGYNLLGARMEDMPNVIERVLTAGSWLYHYGHDVVK